MVNQSDNAARPVLTADEQALLRGHEAVIRTAKSVLDDLEAIGADVAEHRDLLDRTEQMRAGLLQRFSTGVVRPVTRAPRAR